MLPKRNIILMQIWCRFGANMHQICTISAKIWCRSAQNMHQLCTISVQIWCRFQVVLRERQQNYCNCARYALKMHHICTKYAHNLHQICTQSAPNLHQICIGHCRIGAYLHQICTKLALEWCLNSAVGWIFSLIIGALFSWFCWLNKKFHSSSPRFLDALKR